MISAIILAVFHSAGNLYSHRKTNLRTDLLSAVYSISIHSRPVCLCGRVVTVAASCARESGFNSQSRQAWLRLPSFRGRWNEQQLLNNGWLLLTIANVNRRSGKSARHEPLTLWKFILPVGSRRLKRTWAPLRKSEYSTAYDRTEIYIYTRPVQWRAISCLTCSRWIDFACRKFPV